MKDAGLKKSEVDEIVLVGGSTRIPKVCDRISVVFIAYCGIKRRSQGT